MNNTLTQSEYSKLKAKLTRAKNSGDYSKVIRVADEAMAIFAEKGYPDNWRLWERAGEDAKISLRFSGK